MSSPRVTALPPVTGIWGIGAHARARARGRAYARTRAIAVNRENPVTPGNAVTPPPVEVTVLRHCRCLDCRKFYRAEGEFFCRDGIGGTATVLGTGERICDPPADAWHYCAGYDGPPVSRDVWAWPTPPAGAKKWPAPGGGGPGDRPTTSDRSGENRSDGADSTAPAGQRKLFPPIPHPAAQVGAGAKIVAQVELPSKRNAKSGLTKTIPSDTRLQMVPSPGFTSRDGDGNGRDDSFCLSEARTRCKSREKNDIGTSTRRAKRPNPRQSDAYPRRT